MNISSAIAFFKPLLFALIGLALGGVIAALAGEDPLNILRIIVMGVIGTPYDLGLTVYYASILICTGLAVALPFRAGTFNIGGEGQVAVGALSVAAFALIVGDRLPSGLALILGILAAFLGGAVWGAVIGWIRAWRGGHEVISSIMMNFIAAGLTGWLTLNYFRATDSQIPETSEIANVWRWTKWEDFGGAPVTSLTVVCLLVAIVLGVLLKYTATGYQIKAVQQSPDAARIAGISVAKVRFWTLTIAGGIAGLAGAVMVLGNTGRFRMDMSEGFGFLGIPVALLGRGNPYGVVISAILFAILHHGSSALDIEATHVGRDLAQVIEALVVIVVASERFFSLGLWHKFVGKKAANKEPQK